MTERVKSLPELFSEREAIEDEIRSIDNMALVNYELKQLNIMPHPKDYLINLEAENTSLKARIVVLEDALRKIICEDGEYRDADTRHGIATKALNQK